MSQNSEEPMRRSVIAKEHLFKNVLSKTVPQREILKDNGAGCNTISV